MYSYIWVISTSENWTWIINGNGYLLLACLVAVSKYSLNRSNAPFSIFFMTSTWPSLHIVLKNLQGTVEHHYNALIHKIHSCCNQLASYIFTLWICPRRRIEGWGMECHSRFGSLQTVPSDCHSFLHTNSIRFLNTTLVNRVFALKCWIIAINPSVSCRCP